MNSLWSRRGAMLATLGVLAAPRLARAAWPERPIRILVAFPPGSSTDVVARALGQKLGEQTGHSVVVENRPGAGGNLGTLAVKNANDGHTVLMHSTAICVNPNLYRNAGYTLEDFSAVAVVATAPNAFFVHPSVPAANMSELIAYIRANPGVGYAHSGTGTTPHLGAELLFRTLAGVQATPVAFGPAQAATAVVGNQAPIGSTSLPPALPLIRDGRVRPIAVAGARRDPTLPEVATVAEQGYPGFEASTWFGMFAPARTPPEAMRMLLDQVPKAMAAPDLKARLAALSLTDPGLSGEAAQAFVRAQAEVWAGVIRSSGATAD
jgi:tripartite-type tricarboxylate transporter receptor subunit TctC